MAIVRLSLASDRISDAALQDRVRTLGHDIERHSDANAQPEAGTAAANTKGEPITLGVLLVTFMTSGAAVAALNVLKSYLERDRSMSMTLEKPDGSKISLTAADMGDVQDLANRIINNRPAE